LLPMMLLGGCGNGEKLPQITMDNKGQNYDFAVDQKFQLLLPSNQTTGFKWEISDISSGAIEEVKNEYKLSKKYDGQEIVGAGGEEIWTFKVTKIERSRIKMQYLKSWDKTSVANSFNISINGNPDDGMIVLTGIIKSLPAGSEYDDYFESTDGQKFGIAPYTQDNLEDPGIRAKIKEFKDSGKTVEIRGNFVDEAIDYNGKHFAIYEFTGPATL
jgi:inhibitor of cysteine peptidase